jgi:hypothetical protein
MSKGSPNEAVNDLENGKSSDAFIQTIIDSLDKEIANLPKENKPKDFKIKLLETLPDNIQVWSVDGSIIRRDIDDDFVLGTNWKANPNYSGMKDREIWIEKILDSDPVERGCIEIHELVEANLMEHYKLPYHKAHLLASKVEEYYRKQLMK